MTRDDFIITIRQKDYPREDLVQQVLHDREVRELTVELMRQHTAIMVYYHCYEVVRDASAHDARLFLAYQPAFQRLLSHQNSYHRDFGLALLANLTAFSETVDFADFATMYFQCLDDPKFMTAQCCLQYLNQIIMHRNEYTRMIIREIMKPAHFQSYTPKQQALLQSDVLEVFETAYHQGIFQDDIRAHVLEHRESPSPKTKKLAKRLATTMS